MQQACGVTDQKACSLCGFPGKLHVASSGNDYEASCLTTAQRPSDCGVASVITLSSAFNLPRRVLTCLSFLLSNCCTLQGWASRSVPRLRFEMNSATPCNPHLRRLYRATSPPDTRPLLQPAATLPVRAKASPARSMLRQPRNVKTTFSLRFLSTTSCSSQCCLELKHLSSEH